ncbi:MAG: DUF1015 family protein [Bacillota bacterium]|nr:DUF1015 family protein [Bacillota bacterium]
MAVFRPFCAVRPAKEHAGAMVSPPYDVVDRAGAARMAEGNPYSFLHICRSEIDLPEEVGAYEEAVYEKARENIERFLEQGVLIQEERPAYYVYRQEAYGRARTGLAGCVSVDDYKSGVIKRHEVTLAEKEEDRVRHFQVCSCHTEPVFLAYHSHAPLEELLKGWTETHEPEYDVTDAAGVRHLLWPVDLPEIKEKIEAYFTAMGNLYIADGHHRCASAARVGQARRELAADSNGGEEFNYFMAVCFPEDQLDIWDYSRMVKDLAGMTEQEFLEALRQAGFEAGPSQAEPCVPQKRHEFGLNLGGTWYPLIAREAICPQDDPVKGLDVSILQDRVLGPLLGITDPRRDKRIAFVGGKDSLARIGKAVGENGKPGDGSMAAAILLYPVSMSEIMAVADRGAVMPPKSTWFEPKLGSGLFLHRF